MNDLKFRGDISAFGWPGIDPTWSRGDKDGVGSAYSASSKVWFTIWRGLVTEVYYPTIDLPQTRDFQFLLTDGRTFFHDEKRGPPAKVRRLSHHSTGYSMETADAGGRYRLKKEVIADPHLPVVLVNVEFEQLTEGSPIRLYALCAPHMCGAGRHNNGYVVEAAGREILIAERNGFWMAMGATVPFSALSCGYVGSSDGWTDLASNMQMDWKFDKALDGNIALTGELPEGASHSFTLGLAFGRSLHSATTSLFQSLSFPFQESKQRFLEQWERPYDKLLALENDSYDGGNLYHSSYSLLRTHEDKSYPGAFIASLSVPWGESAGDDDIGGYHLVWTRDMVHSVTALMAAGDTETPLRALIYLANVQNQDGGFSQNFWIDGEHYWSGIQLDEVSFPIMLAWRLWKLGALKGFDPYPMVLAAAAYIVKQGPVTEQERWEEVSGYSPSTLAANITALVCASEFAKDRGDHASAQYLLDYADFLESHIESWTVTQCGTLVPDIRKHYIRILPVKIGDDQPQEDPDSAVLELANVAPNEPRFVPARTVVDAGFLELVRYGVRDPTDPLIVDSLKVVDSVLKVETPQGPCWRRYNGDGYGQREDGSPYAGWGKGRAWPLLTGERGHYEIAAGRSAEKFLKSLEAFSSSTGLLPEQIWDSDDIPAKHLYLGKPTGSAMPLMWAHSEYIKLLRSSHDMRVFDKFDSVYLRYVESKTSIKRFEVWSFNRKTTSVKKGYILRVQALSAFRLHWSSDNWTHTKDTDSSTNTLSVYHVDIDTASLDCNRIVFTFYWVKAKKWEGKDFSVTVISP
ncbi:MAG: glycoside hydrolase family 15 protein [Thermoprotei archaeon]